MQRQDTAVTHKSTLTASTSSTTSLGRETRDVDGVTHNRVIVNVGGRRFQTAVETLLKVPDTVLSELARTHLATTRDQQIYEYYFDRSSDMFDHIVNYYRNGILHFPHIFCAAEVYSLYFYITKLLPLVVFIILLH